MRHQIQVFVFKYIKNKIKPNLIKVAIALLLRSGAMEEDNRT